MREPELHRERYLIQNAVFAVIDHGDSGIGAIDSVWNVEAANVNLSAECAFHSSRYLGKEQRIICAFGGGVEVG